MRLEMGTRNIIDIVEYCNINIPRPTATPTAFFRALVPARGCSVNHRSGCALRSMLQSCCPRPGFGPYADAGRERQYFGHHGTRD